MNETSESLKLSKFMESPEGWGRAGGRTTYQLLLDFVESRAGTMIFKVSLEGVKRVDISFASETVVELARRYRGSKGFCFTDLDDADMLENWAAAAARKIQPMMSWNRGKCQVLGVVPSKGTLAAFQFALQRPQTRTAEFAAVTPEMSIANASTKFKQLWEQGFLLRRDDVAVSGGVEYVYYRIG